MTTQFDVNDVFAAEGDIGLLMQQAQPLWVRLIVQIIERELAEGKFVIRDNVIELADWTDPPPLHYHALEVTA